MTGVTLHFLGTGDAFGSGGRLHSATLLRSEAGAVLVDCGPSTLAGLRAQRLDPCQIDAIALTHLHGDHFAGVLPFRFPLTWREFEPRVSVAVGPARVTPYPVAHSRATPCFGLRVDVGGGVFACSGDTEWTDALVEIAAGADLFLCECAGYETAPPKHLTYRVLQQQRHRLTCRRLLLTHMGEEMLARAAALALDVAADGLVIDL